MSKQVFTLDLSNMQIIQVLVLTRMDSVSKCKQQSTQSLFYRAKQFIKTQSKSSKNTALKYQLTTIYMTNYWDHGVTKILIPAQNEQKQRSFIENSESFHSEHLVQ